MTARQLRRAQERKALKMARKAEKNSVERPFQAAMPAFEPASPAPQPYSPSTSEAQLAANRANAQLSTGAKSDEGKAKSSLNAVKTGLTGRTVLLPSEDAALYEQHVREFFAEFQPVGPQETFLVQSLADTGWRLARIPSLEMAIFAHGTIQFADQFADHAPALRSGLIQMHTFLHYEKQLRNLHTQEGRLCRRREKDMAELRTLQLERQRKEAEDLKSADLKNVGQALSPVDSNPNGFEFSDCCSGAAPRAAWGGQPRNSPVLPAAAA